MAWIAWIRAADIQLLLAFSGLSQSWLIVLENIVFSEILLAAFIILPLLIMLYRRGVPAMYWAGVYILMKVTVWSLKYLIGRPRPVEAFEVESSLLLYPQNPSFPSGVAADMAFIAFLLSLCYPRLRLTFAVFFFGLAFLRVTAAAHYPTDVIAGYLLGWLFFVVGGWVRKALLQKREG